MTEFWLSETLQSAFDEIEDRRISHLVNSSLSNSAHGPDRLVSVFQSEAVEVVVDIFNQLLETTTVQDLDDEPAPFIRFAKAEEDEQSGQGCAWAPKYLVRSIVGDGEEETRLIGHVEFLAGKPGALMEAYKLWKSNKWGSLRCVLGLSLPHTLLYTTGLI